MDDTDQTNVDTFDGFEEARRLMACYNARVRTSTRLGMTDFVDDPGIAAVHVDNISRADRVYLLAFDHTGTEVRGDTLYTDEPGQHLDLTPEFDHELTAMPVPAHSQLAAVAATEDGWIINLAELRRYDLGRDRRETQRAVLLAHLGDMLATGDARGFLLGGLTGPDEPDAA